MVCGPFYEAYLLPQTPSEQYLNSLLIPLTYFLQMRMTSLDLAAA